MEEAPPRSKLRRFFSFPLTTGERDIFINHLKSLKDGGFAKDVLLMWNIQMARFSDAKEIAGEASRGGETQRIIREALEKPKV
jgi:hypothetical protein